jgi:CheY-like chemotaxis protein
MTYTPNVLLLDQDHVLRRATALLLSNRGAAVTPAATLEEAISLSQSLIYDVALIDLSPSMPCAREVVLRLRRDGLVPRRIVLCADAPTPVEDDFSEILLKPYAFDRLLRLIFGQRNARQPTRSGVFPRARVAAGALRVVEHGAPADPVCDDVVDALAELPALSGVCDGGRRRAARWDGAAGRGGRRARGATAGRTLRSLRRAPRGSRYPE